MTAGSNGERRTLRIRQVKSAIGFDRRQKATLKAMGLGRIGRARELPDNPQSRGMIGAVSHLVVVEEGPAIPLARREDGGRR